MKLTAEQARERILSGNVEGDHEVIEDLDMHDCTIAAWPHWNFKDVNLSGAEIKKIGGTFAYLDCSESTLEEIDPTLQANSAWFSDCSQLLKVCGNYAGFSAWNNAGITEIDPKTRFGVEQNGLSARFDACVCLTKAQGNFPGFTQWSGSAITQIDAKTQLGVDKKGNSADFSNCKQLNSITYALRPKGNVKGNVSFSVKPQPLGSMEF